MFYEVNEIVKKRLVQSVWFEAESDIESLEKAEKIAKERGFENWAVTCAIFDKKYYGFCDIAKKIICLNP
jgi:uncharacterized protein YihD (DUF1040 family)